MDEIIHRKKGNLTLVTVSEPTQYRGRRRGRRPGPVLLSPAERELERRMRDRFIVMKGADGCTPSRGFAAIAQEDGATPWRTMGRRVLEALRAGARGWVVRGPAVEFLDWTDAQIAARDAKRDTTTHPTTSGEFAA